MRLELEQTVASIPLSVDNDTRNDSAPPQVDVERLLKQGVSAAQSGERALARTLLFRVTEADPRNADAWLWLASISEYPEELLGFLDNVLEIDPDSLRARQWKVATMSLLAKTFVQRGISANDDGQQGYALDCFENALEYDPDCESAWVWKASLAVVEQDRVQFLERALSINPDNEDAKAAFDSILARQYQAKLNEARSAAVDGEFARSEELLDEILEHDPDSIEAWKLRSQVVGPFAEKMIAYRRAYELDASNAFAHEGYEFLAGMIESSATAPAVTEQYVEPPTAEVDDEFSEEMATESEVSDDVNESPDSTYEQRTESVEWPGNVLEELTDMDESTGEAGFTAVPFEYHDSDNETDDRHQFDGTADYGHSNAEEDCEYPEVLESTADEPAFLPQEPGFAESVGLDVQFSAPAEDEASEIESFDESEPVESDESEPVEMESSEPESWYSEPAVQPSFTMESENEASEASDSEDESFAANGSTDPEQHSVDLDSSAPACPYCGVESESNLFECSTCRAVLSLSDIDSLLSNPNPDSDVIQKSVVQLEAEQHHRELTEQELMHLGIGQLNLKNFDSGLAYLHEASKSNPNNVILAGQVNAIAIRLDELRRQTENHDAMPKGKTILVVDDSATVRKLISSKLEKSGHHVVSAVDGVEAMEIIESMTPDLVLLDIAMPRMDGYAVCKLIRSNDETKDVPVVMISGKDGFFDKVRGHLAGTTGYITKPFGPETLMRALETYLLPDQIPSE